jgi:predicted small lipoprotein YifL
MPSTRVLRQGLLLAAVCALALLGGCGRKGPLYLPPPPPAETGRTQTPPAEAGGEEPAKPASAGAETGS